MKLSFWRKTAAVLMAALLALSTPVLALSETLEAAATAEPTAAPAATVTPVVTEAPVETEATTAPEATTVPEATETAIVTEDPAAMETPVAAVAPAVVNAPMAETTPVPTPPIPRAGNLASEQLVFHCTTDETHADQVSNGGSYYKYDTGSMTYDEARGVWTATMKVTNIQTLLTFGRICPDKVWGKKHYHTDENGNTVRMATVTVVWNAETSKWEPEGGAYVINVWCPTKPSKPTLPTDNYLGSTRAITVKDSSNPASEKLTYFRYLKTGTYSFGEVTKDEQGTFWCDLTITDLDYYVQEFNTAKNVSYKIDPTANNSVFVYKFKYIGSSDYKQDGSGWTLDASSYDVSKGETSKTGKVLYVTSLYTVTYTDGVNGTAFANQSYDVKPGSATPAFEGEPTRANYTFAGWQPEVAETVTADVTYTAQWKLAQPATPSGSNSIKELFKFHCVTTPDEHADQTYNWFGSFVKYNGDMAWDETRGVYTATAKITNVQTMLSSGVKSPEKVWGCTHYHTDADGKKVMTATIKLVWDPNADGLNAAGTQTHGLWLPDGEQLVNVWHATQPSAPTIAGLTPRSMGSTVAIRVKDSNGKLNDVVTYFRTLPYCPAGTYAFGPMTKDENGDFWCDLTISNLDYFVSDFNGRNNVSYKIDTAKTTTTFVYKLKYVGDKVNYKQDGTGWTVDSSSWTNGETQKISKILYVAKPCTITYTDGVNGTAFADQVYTDVLEGSATPAFVGKPTREGYVFTGWDPEVAQTVNGDATYTAKWGEDKNGNGFPDDLEDKFIVTYTDGVNGEAFEDQVYSDLLSGLDTPAFQGDTPARKGYVFMGWNPAVTDKVSESVIYTAQWELDENNNGIPDKEEERYSVTYTDGVNGEAFADQVYSDLLEGLNTPEFNGTPERKGYVFAGWEPEVAKTVSGNATYTAKWDEDKNNNGKPDKDETTYTVIYTDGVADEEVFADQKTEGLLEGLDTPAFNGTPERKGYVFAGWQPEVAKTVSGNATYTALWTADKNGNGIPDDQEEHFTVTYTDGTKKHTAFADQVFTGLVKGEATPSFDGKPTRKGYKFLGWKPEVEQTVSGNATYIAQWAKIEAADEDEVPKTGDTTASSMATMLMSLACMGLAVMLLLARSKAQKNR